MNKEKYFQIKVVAKAPQGYKPRTMSITGLGVSNKDKAKELLEAEAIKRYKEALKEVNPEIDFKFSVISSNMNPQFIIVDNEEPAKAKKNRKEVEPAVIGDQEPAGSETEKAE